jgi:2-polyprenyl-3-methyl-5-hydroxy-6-metoxy-1,4-benzoquinol methylase
MGQCISHEVAQFHSDGAFDVLTVERAGLVRLEGWTAIEKRADITVPRCFVDGRELQVFEIFRTYRPDVTAVTKTDNCFLGLTILYRVPEEMPGTFTHLKLTLGEAVIFEAREAYQTQTPPYSRLLAAPDVLRREHIYGYGPPAAIVSDEIQCLGRMAPGPVLDFGCGSGALIKALRAFNIEVYGLELERKPILDSLSPCVKEFVKLYDGSFPMPFANDEFESAIATEVIEHIPEYESALAEIARVARSTFLITVPDISSIPICHHNSVVPWHLLESTHINFFTQTSLTRVLQKHYTDIQFARISPSITNGSKWYGSLAALCRK